MFWHSSSAQPSLLRRMVAGGAACALLGSSFPFNAAAQTMPPEGALATAETAYALSPMRIGNTSGIAITEENFPDQTFRNYVDWNLDTDEDNVLSDAEIAAVESISLSDSFSDSFSLPPIQSFEGLAFFKNLKSFTYSGSSVTTLDMSGNPNLETLHCESSQVAELNVTKNPKLKILDCKGTKIAALDVRSNPELVSLDCWSTPIASVDVSHNQKLETLHVGWSHQLTELTLGDLPALTDLSCTRSSLTALDVSRCPQLEELFCWETQIASLDVSHNPNLRILNCEDSPILQLDLRNNHLLGQLVEGSSDSAVLTHTALSVEMSGEYALSQADGSNILVPFQSYDDSFSLKSLLPALDPARISDVSLTNGATWNAGTATIENIADTTEVSYTYTTGGINAQTGQPITARISFSVQGNVPLPEAPDPTVVTIDYQAETLSFDSAYEVNTAADFSGNELVSGDSLTAYIPENGESFTLYLRRKAADGVPASETTTLVYTGRSAAPTGLTAVSTTFDDSTDGQILGVTPSMEYQPVGAEDWISCTDTGISGLAAGQYLVRTAASAARQAFASQPAAVEILSGPQREEALQLTVPSLSSAVYGYDAFTPEPLTLVNHTERDMTVQSVTVDTDAFTIHGTAATIPAGSSCQAYTIAPVPSLPAGTYKATITVAYQIGTARNSAQAEIALTVTPKPVTLAWPSQTAFPYNGSAQSYLPSVDGLLAGDSATPQYTGSSVTQAVHTGTYTISVTGLDNANYTLTQDTVKTQSWTILPAQIQPSVTLTSEDWIYTGDQICPSVTVMNGTALLEEGIDYTLSYGDNLDAGTDAGSVTVTSVATSNYAFEPVSVTFSILKAPATDAMKTASGSIMTGVAGSVALPALPKGAVYGTPFEEQGTAVGTLALLDGRLHFTSSDLIVSGTAYLVTIPVTGAQNYQDYQITVTLTGTDKLVPDLTVQSLTQPYDGHAILLEDIQKSASSNGTALQGTWSFAQGTVAPKDAGHYTLELTFVPNEAQYATAHIQVSVEIQKRSASVALYLDPSNRILQNDALPTVGIMQRGVLAGENILTSHFIVNGMPDDSSATGDYPLALDQTSRDEILAQPASRNYEITFETACLSILEKDCLLPTPEVSGDDTGKAYRAEQAALEDGLPETAFPTADSIKTELFRVLNTRVQSASETNTLIQDVSLYFSENDGMTWEKATGSTFPNGDVTITIPYPENVENAEQLNYTVVHMRSNGTTEFPTVSKTSTGIRFSVQSLSPIALSWANVKSSSSSVGSENTQPQSPTVTPLPDTDTSSIVYYTCPACGYHNWTATTVGYRCDHCGYVESNKQLSGYGNVSGLYTPQSPTLSSANSTASIPQTGDKSQPVIWFVLLVLSCSGLVGICNFRRKRTNSCQTK